MIRIENLCAVKNNTPILQNISLEIAPGEVVGLIGPSGCGKSTLLRCLALPEEITAGQITLQGENLLQLQAPGKLPAVGMVTQKSTLFHHMTVLENITSVLSQVAGKSHKEACREALEALRLVSLEDKALSYSSELSGGQLQRAAIARMIALSPEVLIMDEPTSALDPLMVGEVEAVIRILAAQHHTMVIVSHNMSLIEELCSRVVYMNRGEIRETGTPEEIFHHPQKEETRQFVGSLRLLQLSINSKNFDFLGMQTTLHQFVFRNGISSLLRDSLDTCMEELCQMIIIRPRDSRRMEAAFRYDPWKKELTGEILFTGPVIDPEEDPYFVFSWPLIRHRTKELTISYPTGSPSGFTNRIAIVF